MFDVCQQEQRKRVEQAYGGEKFVSVFDMTPQPTKDILPHHLSPYVYFSAIFWLD